MPAAIQRDLLRLLSTTDQPARLKEEAVTPRPALKIQTEHPVTVQDVPDLRRLVWEFIEAAPNLRNGGERVGEATAAVEPCPHQIRTFHRLYHQWPLRLLFADEVGLGKTIQAGLLLRQA